MQSDVIQPPRIADLNVMRVCDLPGKVHEANPAKISSYDPLWLRMPYGARTILPGIVSCQPCSQPPQSPQREQFLEVRLAQDIKVDH
jgi:hypothetical protein